MKSDLEGAHINENRKSEISPEARISHNRKNIFDHGTVNGPPQCLAWTIPAVFSLIGVTRAAPQHDNMVVGGQKVVFTRNRCYICVRYFQENSILVSELADSDPYIGIFSNFVIWSFILGGQKVIFIRNQWYHHICCIVQNSYLFLFFADSDPYIGTFLVFIVLGPFLAFSPSYGGLLWNLA